MAVTITEAIHKSIKKITFAWVASGAGVASGATSEIYDGEIIRLVTVPGLALAQPDDNYKVEVLDDDGVDVLMGAGANRDETDTEQVLGTSLGCVGYSKLTLSVSVAGATTAGTVFLYVR